MRRRIVPFIMSLISVIILCHTFGMLRDVG